MEAVMATMDTVLDITYSIFERELEKGFNSPLFFVIFTTAILWIKVKQNNTSAKEDARRCIPHISCRVNFRSTNQQM